MSFACLLYMAHQSKFTWTCIRLQMQLRVLQLEPQCHMRLPLLKRLDVKHASSGRFKKKNPAPVRQPLAEGDVVLQQE